MLKSHTDDKGFFLLAGYGGGWYGMLDDNNQGSRKVFKSSRHHGWTGDLFLWSALVNCNKRWH